MNALKHAHASDMWIAVREHDETIVLQLRDNGVGFDTSAPGPEGHFGMAMMRERAQVGGGTFDVESAPGEGATITVRFPTSLLQSEEMPGGARNGEAAAAEPGGASPGTSGATRLRPTVLLEVRRPSPGPRSTPPPRTGTRLRSRCTTPIGAGIGITSASGVSTSSSVIRWCLVPSIADEHRLAGGPGLARWPHRSPASRRWPRSRPAFSSRPIRISGAAGSRRLTQTNAINRT